MALAPGEQRSAATPLALLWLALIGYASLFPFEGWRWPPGAGLGELMRLHWPRWWGGFDVWANLLGYLPLGLLVGLARLGNERPGPWAWVQAVLAGAAVSYAMELTQQLLPQRVPSLMDWVLNTAGTGIGASLAWGLRGAGFTRRWARLQQRWLARGGGGALALLLCWPLALLFPAPMPLGLGQVAHRLRELALSAIDGVPWAGAAAEWLQPGPAAARLPVLSEGLATALGLLSPCLLLYAASRPGWRRVPLALGVPVLAVVATTLSTALNFGPDHAWAWLTPDVMSVMLAASGVAMLLALTGPRLAASLALVSLTGLVVLVQMAPTDPYFAQSLQGWEQGRFIRFHGLARWIGWLWPYAAMAWLLGRLSHDG